MPKGLLCSFRASKDVYRSFNIPTPAEEDEYAIYFVNVQAEDTITDKDRVVEMFERHDLKVVGVKYGNWRGVRMPGCGDAGHQDVFIFRRL